jgi:hypothetical protein
MAVPAVNVAAAMRMRPSLLQGLKQIDDFLRLESIAGVRRRVNRGRTNTVVVI